MRFSTLLLWAGVLLLPGDSTSADEAISTVIERVESGLAPAEESDRGRGGLNLADRMKHYDVPGVSIAVIDDGAIVWAKGYGVREKNTQTPVGNDTLFQAASISKPVTAVATLQLVQEGKLDLDENVNAYLKSWQVPDNEFTADQPVTLRGIMTHTAGTSVSVFWVIGPTALCRALFRF